MTGSPKQCPSCGARSRCVDSRSYYVVVPTIHRRYVCGVCGTRHATKEISIEVFNAKVVPEKQPRKKECTAEPKVTKALIAWRDRILKKL